MKISIVNEQDEVIGEKDRNEIDYKKDIFRVAALWVTNSNKDILLCKRVASKRLYPNRWECAVSGTLEQDETYDQAILREASEELGIEGVLFSLGPKVLLTENAQAFVQWYLATIDRNTDTFHPQPEEIQEARWFTRAELPELLEKNPDDFVPETKQWFNLFI